MTGAPRASLGGAGRPGGGLDRRLEFFQSPAGQNTAVGWPILSARYGTPGGAISPSALVGAGASGYGGNSAFGGPPQLTWVEGGHRGYDLNIPLKFASLAREWVNEQDEMTIVSAVMKWEALAAPAAGFDSGFFITTWTANLPGSIILNQTGGGSAVARMFGIYRQQVTGAFGFVAVNGVTVTHTPLVHPAGDVRVATKVEYRIRNAKDGRAAGLQVFLNDQLKLTADFAAANALGLPTNYSGATEQSFTPIAEAANAERVWCGSLNFSQGPDSPGMLD